MVIEIWQSFRRMPLWVQIWVAIILVPVNLFAAAFFADPYGIWVAILAVGGMTPNLPIMIFERGFSRRMALSHLVFWIPLACLILWLLVAGPDLAPAYRTFLFLLLAIDLISLGFDIPDTIRWARGQRGIA